MTALLIVNSTRSGKNATLMEWVQRVKRCVNVKQLTLMSVQG